MSRSTARILVGTAMLALFSAGGAFPAVAASAGSGEALEALLARVPEDHRGTCRADLVTDPDPRMIMSVRCEVAPAITVYYTRFDGPEAISERYERRMERESIEEGTGDCSTAVPGANSYTINGARAGRYLCYEALGYVTLHWTHEDTDIYAQAFVDGEPADLWAWWSTGSGPITQAVDAAPTGQGAALDELLGRVPETHRGTCRPFDGGGLEDGVLASVKCDVASDIDVYYRQVDSLETLGEDHDQGVASAAIDRDTGDCSTAVPGEMGYTIGGESAGRLLCTEFFDSISLRWTHEPTLITATAFSERDLEDLWTWWLTESGPNG